MKKTFMILRNQVDGEGAAPAAEVEGQEPAPETAHELTAGQQELAALKEENARLKAQPAPAPAVVPTAITSATLEGYTADQWAIIEERTGKDKATILRDYKDFELTNRQNAIDAKTNTTEALQDAIEANPKLIKLRASIKEFMEDVPMSDKLDPAKLKRHMEKAITYAKGKHITNTPDTPAPQRKPGESASPKGAELEEYEDAIDGEVKNDEYTSDTGLRIKTGKVDKDRWKQIRSKTRGPNSVTIPGDFDKPPSFK